MSEAPLAPAEGERIVWGAVRRAAAPPSERKQFYQSLLSLAFGAVGIGLTILSAAGDMEKLRIYIPLIVIAFAGSIVWPYVLPGFRQRLAERKDEWLDAMTTPRADALWLSDTRLVVEPRDRPDTDFAVPLSDLANPRLDYDAGARVVVVDWPGGPIILRTHDADGLLGALRSRIGSATR